MKVTMSKPHIFSSAWLPKCQVCNVQLAERVDIFQNIVEFFTDSTEEIRELARDLMQAADDLDQHIKEESAIAGPVGINVARLLGLKLPPIKGVEDDTKTTA